MMPVFLVWVFSICYGELEWQVILGLDISGFALFSKRTNFGGFFFFNKIFLNLGKFGLDFKVEMSIVF